MQSCRSALPSMPGTMLLSWGILLMCYQSFIAGQEALPNLIAHSRVKSAGLVSKNMFGARININIQTRNSEGDAASRRANEVIKRACMTRIAVLMGDASDALTYKRELLLCQYQELHAHMKKEQMEYERGLRQGAINNFTNPYRREYGSAVVNAHSFSFLHTPPPCEPHHNILIAIHSAAQNNEKRSTIRGTWGNPRIIREFFPKGYSAKLVFILGIPQNSSNRSMIDYEVEMYRDIIQVDFLDHYYNNTYKAIYNMKWISSYGGCRKVQLVIKADDDIMFNVRKFPGFWKVFTLHIGDNLTSESLTIAGNMFGGGPPRDPTSKWYIPYELFKYDTFPPWFQGMVYFFTPGLAGKIYDLSFTTPYLFTDDVYVGILADRLDDISRWNFASYYNFVYDPLDKKMLKWRFEPIVFYHNPSVVEMYSLWFSSCTYKSCR